MRIEVAARDIVPGDRIWFAGSRKPSTVQEVNIQNGAEKLVVLHSDTSIWYLLHATGQVFKYEPNPESEEDSEAVFLDPDGNPT